MGDPDRLGRLTLVLLSLRPGRPRLFCALQRTGLLPMALENRVTV